MGGKTSTSFKPGRSGNPKGRPPADMTAREMARAYRREAVEALRDVVRGKKKGDVVRAAQALLDRAEGKPMQSLELTGAGGGPVEVSHVRDRLNARIAALVDARRAAAAPGKPH